MAPQTLTQPEQEQAAEKKIQQLRELFADADDLGKKALENVLSELKEQVSKAPPPPIESAGRVGARLGKRSELTMIVPLVPGGAKRLHAFLKMLGGNLDGAKKVGTLHDMRFVFIDNDTTIAVCHILRRRLGHLYRRLHRVDSRLPGPHGLCLGRLAGDSQPTGETISYRPPDHGGRLVRRTSGSHRG